MNNWHLLTLALVAIFKPIASFTERNLVDGRQQCCDRQSEALLRASRGEIYGNHQSAKTESPVRLNSWDESREERRHDLRQRDTIFNRRSTAKSDITERNSRRSFSIIRSNRVESQPEIKNDYERLNGVQQRERNAAGSRVIKTAGDTRQHIARERESYVRRVTSSRVDERRYLSDSENRKHEQYSDERRLLSKSFRVVDRHIRTRVNSRDEERENRDHIGASRRLTTERDERRQQIDGLRKSREQVRPNVNDARRDIRNHLSANRRIADRMEVRSQEINGLRESREQIKNIVRDVRQENRNRFSAGRRMTARMEERRHRDDITQSRGERALMRDARQQDRDYVSANRQMSQKSEELRQQTDSLGRSRVQIRYSGRDVRRASRENMSANPLQTTVRLEERRHQNGNRQSREQMVDRDNDAREKNRVNANRQILTVRLQRDELRSMQFREQTRENTDRRLSPENRQMTRRDIRGLRSMTDLNIRQDRAIENRRYTRNSERRTSETREDHSKEPRLESRTSRRMLSLERDNRETYQMYVLRNNRVTIRRTRSVDDETFRGARSGTKLSRTVPVLDFSRKQVVSHQRIETRSQEIADGRFRNVDSTNMRVQTNKSETEAQPSNWEYVLFILQVVYLCGLFLQMLSPNPIGKSKRMYLGWWPLSSQRHIKVD